MTYHYTMCGLDYVYLRNGYRTHDTEYGSGTSIERADELDRAIAISILTSYSRLCGQEVRFLRALADHSQSELALCLGVKRVTVARWELAPHTPIPGPADRTIRIQIANELFGEKVLGIIAGEFSEFYDESPDQLVMSYRPDDEDEPSLFPEEKGMADGWRKEKKVA